MRKFLFFLSICILLLITILLVNAFRMGSRQYNVPESGKILVNDSSVNRLAEAIQIQTIAYDSSARIDSNEFRKMIRFLEVNYPVADSHLNKQVVNSFSVFYTWKGKVPSLKPVILLAHLDVVPPEGEWEEEPFGGTVKNNYIWGRGSLDDKVSALGILEAAEELIKKGFQPDRTIYFAFGHDEETGGEKGAAKIADWFRKNKIKAEFLLDEGLVITDGVVPGIEKPAALIGIAEKGYMTLRLSVEMHSGHSSMPEKETAIGVLSAAVARLEKNPLEARLSEPAQKFLDYIGPEMGFFKKVIFANRWLFGKLILNTYEKTSTGNALVRTTFAPTILDAGVKENVIPEKAIAIVNLRILPGESKEEVIDELNKRMADERVRIEILKYQASSIVSSDDSFGYKTIDSTVRRIFPNTMVAPSLMIAGTDSKHYSDVTENIYRFLPVVMTKEDIARIHGKDERIHIEGYKNVIRFYYSFISNL